MNITICGGGNLGHVTAGFLAARAGTDVSVLTRRPEQWNRVLTILEPSGNELHGSLSTVSSKPEDVIPEADIVIFCLPAFAIKDELNKIKACLRQNTIVGSVVSNGGFFFDAMAFLPETNPLFGFQRVPFISRIIEYGKSAELKGYKPSLSVAVEHSENKSEIAAMLSTLFEVPVKLLKSYYEVSLSNSNPLLHPARLYTMWKDYRSMVVYESNPLFYEEWDDAASSLLIEMDDEFERLLTLLPVEKGSIPGILEYYESVDAESLTRKITSIEAFKGIKAPMVQYGNGWIPDFSSRYFTEDILYGMRFIVETAEKQKFALPVISKVYKWGLNCINSTF